MVGASASQIFLLGGSQGNAWSFAAFPRKEFTAFCWPADVQLPALHKLPTTIAGARSGVSEVRAASWHRRGLGTGPPAAGRVCPK